MPYVMRCRRPRHAIWFHQVESTTLQRTQELHGLHDEVMVQATAGPPQPPATSSKVWRRPHRGAWQFSRRDELLHSGPRRGTKLVHAMGSVVDDRVCVYREWPDRSMGDWTVPSQG